LSRPHEDRERHTLVDHRPGGSPVAFSAESWVAVGVAGVKAERTDACLSAYETLVEKARTSNAHAGPAALLASGDGRRVVILLGVAGHEGFRHLAAAWDDHHRVAQHRDIAEALSLALYEVVANVGSAGVDPAAHDVTQYERIDKPLPRASEVFTALRRAPDFRGATVLRKDGATATLILSSFAHAAAYESFRASDEAVAVLGPVGQPGDTNFPVHARKTIAAGN
jgi:hypothetical protein